MDKPKSSEIAWQRRQSKKLSNAIRSYNSAITRASKSGVDTSLLPDRLSVADVKSGIKTAKELNTRIKDLSRANIKTLTTVKQSKAGATLTAYDLRQIKLEVNRVNRKRVKVKEVFKNLGNNIIEQLGFHKRGFNWDKKTNTDIKKLKAQLNIQQRDDYYDISFNQYRANYFSAMAQNGFSMEQINAVESLTKDLSPTEFMQLSLSEPSLKIGFTYDPHDANQKMQLMLEKWQEKITN